MALQEEISRLTEVKLHLLSELSLEKEQHQADLAELESLRDQQGELQEELQQTQAALLSKNKELSELRKGNHAAALTAAEDRAKRLAAENRALQAQLNEALKGAAAASAASSPSHEPAAAAPAADEGKMSRLIETNGRLHARVVELQQQLESSQREAAAAVAAPLLSQSTGPDVVAELRSELASMTARASRLNKQLEAFRERSADDIRQHQQRISELETDVRRRNEQLTQLQRSIADYKDPEREKLESDLRMMVEAADKERVARGESETLLEEAKADLARVRQRLEQKEKKRAAEASSTLAQISDMRDRLDSALHDVAAERLSRELAEEALNELRRRLGHSGSAGVVDAALAAVAADRSSSNAKRGTASRSDPLQIPAASGKEKERGVEVSRNSNSSISSSSSSSTSHSNALELEKQKIRREVEEASRRKREEELARVRREMETAIRRQIEVELTEQFERAQKEQKQANVRALRQQIDELSSVVHTFSLFENALNPILSTFPKFNK